MINERFLKKKQDERRKKIESRKRKNRIRIFSLSLILVVFASLWYLPGILNRNANADSAKIMAKEDESSLEAEPRGYKEEVVSYKKVLDDTILIEEVNQQSQELIKLSKDEYVKYMGTEDGWSKITHKGYIGYVRDNKLKEINTNELKVLKGILVVTKDYYIPKDYNGMFSVETENALLVMLEAMRREGLNVEVSLKYIPGDFNSEDLNLDIEHNELRTGEAVKFNSISKRKLSDTAEGKWLKNNSYKFGFIQRYPEDKEYITFVSGNDDIYRYVGNENAKMIHDNDIVIEEFIK